MTIVLLILKIIGIALLAILGLFVLLLLLALFVPVRYRAQGGYHRDTPWSAQVKVNWLLHLISVTANLREGDNDIGLRIFGIKIKLDKMIKEPEPEEEPEGSVEQARTEESEKRESSPAEKPEEAEFKQEKSEENGEPPAAEPEQTEEAETQGKKAPAEKSEENEEPSAAKTEETPEEEAEPEVLGEKPKGKNVFRRLADKLRELKQKLTDTVRHIQAAVKNFAETVGRIKELLVDERNHAAVRFLGGKLFFLLKKLIPKKLVLDLQYSTGAPDTTGELLGVAAMFPIGYRNRWNVTPDFEADQAYVETDFEVQGRVFLFRFVGVGISILANKDCRYLFKKLKNIF